MKKLLSLLALLGLLGFAVTPTFAQEEIEVLDDGQGIVAEEETAVVEEETTTVEDETADAEESATNEESIEQVLADNPELVNDLNAGLNDVLGALEEENPGITDEFNAQFSTDEEKAAAALGLAAIFASLGMGALIIGLILWIIKTIALWKAFTKAGEAGWKAIIPVYNTYIQFKLAGMKNWFWYMIIIAFVIGIIAACLPDYESVITGIAYLVSGIIGIIASFNFARNYGWGVFTSILFVLFYPICILILGFGNSKYIGNNSEETVVEA